jgi:hypothetical protein
MFEHTCSTLVCRGVMYFSERCREKARSVSEGKEKSEMKSRIRMGASCSSCDRGLHRHTRDGRKMR